MKLGAKPYPEYARKPIHTNTIPINPVTVMGSTSDPMITGKENTMLVIGNASAYWNGVT